MESILKKNKEIKLGFSEVKHVKPIKIIIHNEGTRPIDKELLPNNRENEELEFDKKIGWLWNWLF